MTVDKTYLELSEAEGTSHKFYEVIVEGNEVRLRFGRIGDSGQSRSKTYATPEKAQAEAAKKIKEKLRDGYQHAVMGVRQKRPLTRRQISSTPSTAERSPIIWRFNSNSPAFGIFIDAESCWLGNQKGLVYKLDHQGQVLNQYQLPEGVKCLVADDVWIYVGCDDGNVYDLTGKLPRLAYEIDEQVDIYWLDIYDGILGVSDANGGLSHINPEGEVQWTRLSSGKSGWMVRCDALGFYHGHAAGITLYDRLSGRQIWHQPTQGSVLFGWQEADTVYAGSSSKKIYRLDKASGEVQTIYICDASVYSCATASGGQYVFGGDSSSSLYCFEQEGKRLWKLATGCGSALSMQWWADHLYIVTTDGVLSCIDVSPAAIQAAQEGQIPQAISLKAPQAPVSSFSTTLETVSDSSQGVIVECFQQDSKLRMRVVSPGYNSDWMVQFPRDIRQEGSRYLVQEIRVAKQGNFYRAYGEIKKLV